MKIQLIFKKVFPSRAHSFLGFFGKGERLKWGQGSNVKKSKKKK